MSFKFSNFQSSPITIDGVEWSTVEHYYQGMKTEDLQIQNKCRKLDTPGKAKRFGRKVQLRDDWERIKETVMETALRAKFKHPDFKQSLLSSGDEEIVEWNKWHDNEWGSCLCVKCRHKTGKNKLGKLLMKLRTELK